MTGLDNWLDHPFITLSQVKRDEALTEWQTVAAEAERLGYASHARDLAPMHDASTRSIKIRTGKLRRFIKAVTQ